LVRSSMHGLGYECCCVRHDIGLSLLSGITTFDDLFRHRQSYPHDGAYKHRYSVNFDGSFGVESAVLSDSSHQIFYVEFAALSDSEVFDSLWGVRCSERLRHWRHPCRGISCALNISTLSQAFVLGFNTPLNNSELSGVPYALCTFFQPLYRDGRP